MRVRLLAIISLALLVGLPACSAEDKVMVSPPPRTETTPGPLTDTAIGFAVIADSGGGAAQQDVADAVLAWKKSGYRVQALVTAGDNVYNRGEPSKYQAQLDQPYEALGVPMYIAIGNHDEPNKTAMLKHMKMTAPPSKVTIGIVDLFFLDSNKVDSAQASWLADALAKSAAKTKVVIYHHPAYSCGKHGNTRKVIEKWVPVIEKGGVDVVFSGHDHNYQRFEQSGIQWVVTGGGGRDITPLTPQCDAETAATMHQFVGFEARADGHWRIRAVDTAGNIIDEAEGRP